MSINHSKQTHIVEHGWQKSSAPARGALFHATTEDRGNTRTHASKRSPARSANSNRFSPEKFRRADAAVSRRSSSFSSRFLMGPRTEQRSVASPSFERGCVQSVMVGLNRTLFGITCCIHYGKLKFNQICSNLKIQTQFLAPH